MARTFFASASALTPGAAATLIPVYWLGMLNQRCTSASVPTTMVAPPMDVAFAQSKTPQTVTFCTPSAVVTPMRLPTVRCLSWASLVLIETVPRLVGGTPTE